MSPNSVCNHTRDKTNWTPAILLITCMIKDRTGLHSVLLPLSKGTVYETLVDKTFWMRNFEFPRHRKCVNNENIKRSYGKLKMNEITVKR